MRASSHGEFLQVEDAVLKTQYVWQLNDYRFKLPEGSDSEFGVQQFNLDFYSALIKTFHGTEGARYIRSIQTQCQLGNGVQVFKWLHVEMNYSPENDHKEQTGRLLKLQAKSGSEQDIQNYLTMFFYLNQTARLDNQILVDMIQSQVQRCPTLATTIELWKESAPPGHRDALALASKCDSRLREKVHVSSQVFSQGNRHAHASIFSMDEPTYSKSAICRTNSAPNLPETHLSTT